MIRPNHAIEAISLPKTTAGLQKPLLLHTRSRRIFSSFLRISDRTERKSKLKRSPDQMWPLHSREKGYLSGFLSTAKAMKRIDVLRRAPVPGIRRWRWKNPPKIIFKKERENDTGEFDQVQARFLYCPWPRMCASISIKDRTMKPAYNWRKDARIRGHFPR